MHLGNKKLLVVFLSVIMGSIFIGLVTYFYFKSGGSQEYSTLSAIENYASTLPEFPPSDDQDWENPHFSNFYETRKPSLFSQALYFFGLGQRPPWSLPFLAELLQSQTETNRSKGLVDGSKSFLHIRAQTSTRLIIFGDIHGSFHSLIRDLIYLREKGFISDDLKITSQHLFLVFNGDFIDRSPYSVDALILLALLMKNNLDNVIYIAGKHERDEYWKDYDLKRELVSRGRDFSKEAIPFSSQIIAFFASLPAALYVSGTNDDKELIRVSFFAKDKIAFDETMLDPSFLKRSSQLEIYQVGEQDPQDEKIDVRASIETEEWKKSHRITNGIGMLDQDRGATTWAVLSSPIVAHQYYLNFQEDAFAVIDLDQNVREATISCIHQNARKLDGFFEEAPLNLVSGQEASKKRIVDTLKLGSTMSLVRGIPTTGKQIKAGISARINEYNRNAQNPAKIIRLFIDNDDYEPERARVNTKKQLNLGINFFLSPLGTATLYSYLDLISENKAVIFFPLSGSSSLRSNKFTNLIHFRASYEDEARALIRVMKNEYGAGKFAFFYQDDGFGRVLLEAAKVELAKFGITSFLPLPYARGSSSFSSHVQEIKEYSPDALGFFAVATATKELIRNLGVDALLSMNLFAVSAVGEVQLRRFIKSKGLSILYGSAVPNPFMSERPIAVAYREAMKKDDSILGIASFESYLATSLFLHGLAQVRSESPTPHDVLKVIEGMKDIDLQGIKLGFNPTTRSLAKEVYIETDEASIWREYPIESMP